MMIKRLWIACLLLLWSGSSLAALPDCKDVFIYPSTYGAALNFSGTPTTTYSGDVTWSGNRTLVGGEIIKVEGKLTTNNGTKLSITGTGPVILLAEEFQFKSGSKLNDGGSAENLFLWANKKIDVDNGVKVTGFLWTNTDVIQLNSGVTVTGGLGTGYNKYDLASGVTVNTVATDDLAFGDFCQAKESSSTYFYQISTDGNGVTCLGEDVTIKVCQDENCSLLATEAVSVTLSPSSGWDGGNTPSITGQTTLKLWSGTAGTVDLGLTPSSGSVSCQVGDSNVALSDCDISFVSSALVLEPGSPLGCKPDTMTVRAVRASDSDPLQCAAAFTGNQTIDFTLTAVSPASPVGSPTFELAGSNLGLGSTQSRTLTFNSSGEASVDYRYDDAGKLNLSARYEQDQDGETISLTGDSDIVFTPAGFHLSSPDSGVICAAGDESCDRFASAGENFTLSVKTACWEQDNDPDFSNNATTLNFEHVGIAVKPSLVAPSGGEVGTLGYGNVAIQAGDNGVGAKTDMKIGEVGVFKWLLDGDVSYFERTISEENDSSANLGRFSPAYLRITGNSPELDDYCSGMTYLGQSMGFVSEPGAIPAVYPPTLTVKGINATDEETKNYNSAFWKLPLSLPRSYKDDGFAGAITEAVAGTVTEDEDSVDDFTIPRDLWLDGTQVVYERDSTLITPFDSALDITFTQAGLTDDDGICFRDSVDSECRAFTIEDIGGTNLRYGRLALTNVSVAETVDLIAPLKAEYYGFSDADPSNTVFQLNGADSCTILPPVNLTLTASESLNATGTGALSGGIGSLTVGRPSGALEAMAEYRLEAGMADMPWLQWYWGRDNNADEDDLNCFEEDETTPQLCNPKARLNFGRYRGHDKVIYRRERPRTNLSP